MMPTRFVCVMIFRMNPEKKELEFLVIESISTHPKTGQRSEKNLKFPGGVNRIPDEPIDMTGKREVLEETYLAFVRYEQVWEKQVSAEHTKYGLLVRFDDCRGELRATELVDNGDEMSPPRWEPLSALKFSLFSGHQPALLAAMERLGIY
ncbi:MAG: hypothetical protein Q7S54_00565 [bacterium]|nr:hypothetical protein [bacterium]